MVEEMSPGLSAFWAWPTQVALMATQRPLIACSAAGRTRPAFAAGLHDVVGGCNRRRAQHDRHRGGHRLRRHHRRRHHADRVGCG